MTPFEVLNEVKRRSAEAVIAQSGLAHEGLRRHLRTLLGGDNPAIGAMLQEPVLEGAHPFVTAAATMAALAGPLLHPDLVAALDSLPAGHDYRFPRTRKPFLHQADAWRLLAEAEPQSVLVTSGTGSGKTECFLFPILSDLVTQAQGRREPLEGVQAIMLYPLNALIESQRERLSAWTQPFGGRVRYCLYNGDLPRAAKESERRRTPEEVIDRERLRASPPPLLVTNITMLEYMLARAEDRPIIDASQGKLKWIVLDEAHSLVGAAAAEIALLLRRVMLAFSVKPEEVRFVATSATIGSGENVRQQLQRFLADVAGIPDDRVHVIEGRRRMPRRPEGAHVRSPVDIRAAEPAVLYDILGRDPNTWRLVEWLFDGSVALADFDAPAKTYGVDAADLIFAMSRAARNPADMEEERLAPIRLHAFERAVPGIWSCINPACSQRPPDWPFGRILPERADECPSCGAPVLEVVSCFECGEAFLQGVEAGPRLAAPLRNPPRDEFAFDSARENDGGPEDADDAEDDAAQQEDVPAWDRLFAANPTPAARGFWLDEKAGWRVADGPGDGGLSLRYEEHHGPRVCPHCSPTGRQGPELIRPLRFGAPFILGNAAPILLEGVEPAKAEAGEKLPSAGRRLLSFTDTLSYVPPEDPVVSTRDVAWQSLPVPELGRYRCSREGLVYYSNRGGPGGSGYAICLQCGRAEADSDNRGLSSPLPALVDHKPLRYRKGQDLCPGNDKPFSIKRNLALGLEITTDVFELQPRHTLRRAGANALVIALREALAQELGVEADEMGFAVGQSQNALGAPAVSLFLFDRAAGGAGFAVSFEHLMRPVIRRAEQILDCETPGCEKACAACVLTSDAPGGKDELDRTAALAFLRTHLKFPDELGPDERFVDGAGLSLAPLDEIDRELRLSARSTLTVFLPDRSNPAAFQDWPLAAELLDWRKRGHGTQLALAPALLATLTPAEKLGLRDFALQHNVGLATAEAPAFPNGAHALAIVDTEGDSSRIWATREAEPRVPGPAWGRPIGHPVVRGSASIAMSFAAVDLDALLPPPGAQLRQIGTELDCDLATFGTRASKIIVELLMKCGSWPKAGIAQAVYRDSYVSSPLVTRLLIDTMKQIFSQSGATEAALVIETRSPRPKDVRGDPWQIWHDWRDAADQKAVIELFGKQRGVRVSLRQMDVPHGRYLDIDFADGSTATIVLDQGFGAWAPPRQVTVRYDFAIDATTQVRRLATVNAILERRGVGKTYFVATSGKT
ncbi:MULTISPECIES: DEAD/DEAH box helicase [unclassified Chelatococcus]|uniref:DEAD/DEAH box helicase n=1 Tax=unclassified Chelatococcus TaxID=2638111 RepID=UPI001BCBC0C8|nr:MULTISPECIES: DEAD/DEAH box helicase [unclassified Chelatococcus]MBS7701437.1 DEAD/DEAH box helicase [Chelatococcus sp. YT9]MBX3559927.1 DEAD/DEAH box helicase [Chelatococcus sp.]